MISVIIPALNEVKALPDTLDALFRQPGDFEVILVAIENRNVTLIFKWNI